jgi:hypothetical protein
MYRNHDFQQWYELKEDRTVIAIWTYPAYTAERQMTSRAPSEALLQHQPYIVT